jgi:RNA polymerase sigma-70 factor (ECF subfamily)
VNTATPSLAPVQVASRAAVHAPVRPTVEGAFREYAGPVHNYLKAAGVVDSEDVLGDVFVDVMRGLERFRGDQDDLRRWIFTIAHHRVVDEHRRATRRRRLLRSVPTEASFTHDEPIDPALVAALDTLTPDQREVIVLRFVADLSLETVATITKRPQGAVKSLQHRALRNLAALLASA